MNTDEERKLAAKLAQKAPLVGGKVPASNLGSGTPGTNYLRGDQTWQTIAGGGDMMKSTYDPNSTGKIANAQLTSGTDIADAITKKHANTLDHSNSLDHANTLDHASTNDPTADQKAALEGTSGAPSVTNKFVTNADSRNSDARTPTSHGHSENILHSLATAVSDFLVASGSGAFVKKTLAEVKTLLDWAADIATHAALTTAHAAATNLEKIASKGAVSGYAGLDAAQKVPTVNLGGTGASGSNYLRGDQTWAAPTAEASVNIKQTEIDFGATPVAEGSFVVTDASVLVTSQLIGTVAYEAPTGKDLDELEMDGLDLKFAPGAGQFTLYARGLDGYIADKFKINYLIG